MRKFFGYIILGFIFFLYVLSKGTKIVKEETQESSESKEQYPEAVEPEETDVCIEGNLYYKTPWKCK